MSGLLETETIDKLFLELSQFTKARTKRERELIKPIEFAVNNGANWTLDDWRNWIEYHAKPALGEDK